MDNGVTIFDSLFGSNPHIGKKPLGRWQDGVDHHHLSYQQKMHHTPILDFFPKSTNQKLIHITKVFRLSPKGIPNIIDIFPSSTHFQLQRLHHGGLGCLKAFQHLQLFSQFILMSLESPQVTKLHS